ncbi:MAG TPA: hypothetical protein VL989_03070 [Candidatus Sulfotelmatobacter sp.]|nr:hypothetical protein [Candidatus Sulfotelmatobacter sp.]
MTSLIISVKEARKLLGKDYNHLSDEQIEDLIINLHEIAKGALRMATDRVLNKNSVE